MSIDVAIVSVLFIQPLPKATVLTIPFFLLFVYISHFHGAVTSKTGRNNLKREWFILTGHFRVSREGMVEQCEPGSVVMVTHQEAEKQAKTRGCHHFKCLPTPNDLLPLTKRQLPKSLIFPKWHHQFRNKHLGLESFGNIWDTNDCIICPLKFSHRFMHIVYIFHWSF